MVDVCITGIGIITAIGKTFDENRNNLKKGKTGIASARFLQSKYEKIFPFGEVPYSTEELMDLYGYRNEKGMTRTDILASIAFDDAIKDAGISSQALSAYDTAFLSSSTVGGMSMTDELYRDGNKIGTPSDYLSSYICGAHTLKLVDRYKIKGFSTTFNTACSSSANSIMLGSKLIQSGRVKRAIVGGADGLAKFTVNGFNALRILSQKPCMPFDKDRSGLTLGEGAAYLVLESSADISNKKIYGKVSGYGNSNDAYHPSSISDDARGIVDAVSMALQTAALKPDQIDYINAHGTGTENNDHSELIGLNKVFGNIPPYQSTKSYTGHTLAAAGAVEAVFSLSAINHNEIYTSLNFSQLMEDQDKKPILEYQQLEVEHVLSNSFGFGGNCSSLVFSKV